MNKLDVIIKHRRNMETKREKIITKAIEIIKSNPNGIRYSELIRKIQGEFPDIPENTISGTIWKLETQVAEVYKPARGLFRHTTFKELEINEEKRETPPTVEKIKEEIFYQPFADWLVNELEECTKPPTEIVSAEIKIETGNLIRAFGQAASYKLFCHKSYIVIPRESPEEDIARLDASCRIFGIGLILYDISSPETPQFEIRVRGTEPDMFYVNKYMKLVEDDSGRIETVSFSASYWKHRSEQ